MDTVKVKKEEVLLVLNENRAAHKAAFDEANANYRADCVTAMRKRADEIEGGADIDTLFTLPKPEDHSDDYDDAITALEHHQDDVVELDFDGDFQKWMLNKWHWDRSFLANTMSYTVGAKNGR